MVGSSHPAIPLLRVRLSHEEQPEALLDCLESYTQTARHLALRRPGAMSHVDDLVQ